jgi:hypothetical protein
MKVVFSPAYREYDRNYSEAEIKQESSSWERVTEGIRCLDTNYG